MSRHEALTPDDHRDLRIQERRDAALGDARMACIVVPAEFRALQAEYPILFRLNETRDRFSALAMFGFENGENLYLADGRWDARYRPLAIDIQPFLIGGRPDEDGPKQIHVDVASPRIATGDEGVRVFDKHGRPTPYLERVIEQIGELDHGFRESGDFFAALQRHALLEPFTLEVTLEDRSDNRLVGYHIIDEARLNSLSGTALAELQAAGHLEPIYMAMASLSQFSALIARRNRRAARG